MSSKAGSVLAWYQGWAARRAVMSAGSWPWRAYQVTMRVWVSRAKGTVRATITRTGLVWNEPYRRQGASAVWVAWARP
jgi:hypothetical protein